jgi:hypothetical protein
VDELAILEKESLSPPKTQKKKSDCTYEVKNMKRLSTTLLKNET